MIESVGHTAVDKFLEELTDLCIKHDIDVFMLGGDSGVYYKHNKTKQEILVENVAIENGLLTIGKVYKGII